MRGYRAVTAVIAATVIVAAGTHLGGQGSSPARVGGAGAGSVQTANLWVDTDGGTCTRNSSAAAYATAAACSSLLSAYAAASCGDTILVQAGTYGGNAGEVINARSGDTACGSDVTIQAASGATVNLGDGTNHTGTCKVNTSNNDYCGSHLVFKGVNFVVSTFIPQGANNVTMDGVTIGAAGGGLFPSGNNFTLKNSTIGPATAGATTGSDGIHLDTDGGTNVNGTTVLQPTTYTIQDNLFRNVICRPAHCGSGLGGDGTDHTDAIQMLAGTSVTIQRNKFQNVDDDLIVGCEHGNSACASLLFQNNMSGTLHGDVTYAVQVSSAGLTSATISFNSFSSGTIIAGGGSYLIDSNYISSWGSSNCTSITTSSATFTYNLLPFGSTQCGATNTVLGSGSSVSFTDAANADLHVPAGASYQGNGLGNPSGGPSTDYDNGSRGNPPDVGADES